MSRSIYRTMSSFAVTAVFALACAATARAGGFGIDLMLPDPKDARTKDALLLVKPVGCHGPGATLTVRAEGIVNGQRKTIPVKVTVVSRGNDRDPFATYAVRRQWPVEGVWVLAITARPGGMEADGKDYTAHASALVEMENGGKVRLLPESGKNGGGRVAVRYGGRLDSREIDTALKTASARAGRRAER